MDKYVGLKVMLIQTYNENGNANFNSNYVGKMMYIEKYYEHSHKFVVSTKHVDDGRTITSDVYAEHLMPSILATTNKKDVSLYE